MSADTTPELVLIAAVARGGVIGGENRLLWHLPEDMRHFRALTSGHAVIMGRKTWESLPAKFRPLPGRHNIVVSRNADYQAAGATLASSLPAALAVCAPAAPAFVIGGAEIYAQALPFAKRLELTEIDAEFVGDAYFPPWPKTAWEEVKRESHLSSEGWRFSFVSYRRSA